ncbi:MAG: hypothetical protein P8107_01550 [Spirochaetia bacterium]
MLKKLMLILFCVLVAGAFTMCDSGKKPTDQQGNTAQGEAMENTSQPAGKIPVGKQLDAVCMYEGLGIRNMPVNTKSAEFKWIGNIKLGDVVTYLGETAKEDNKADGYDMIKVKDLNGKVGWVFYVNMVVDAKPGVAVATTKIYSTPQLTSVTSKKLEPMSIFGVLKGETKDNFAQVAVNPEYPFWLVSDDISTADYDVALARLYTIAKGQLKAGKISKKQYADKLDEMRSDKLYANSVFIPVIDEEYQKLVMELESDNGGGNNQSDSDNQATDDSTSDDTGTDAGD